MRIASARTFLALPLLLTIIPPGGAEPPVRRFASPAPVLAVALSPNGDDIAFSAADGSIHIWQQRLFPIVYQRQFWARVSCLAYSPQHLEVVFGDEAGRVGVWNGDSCRAAIFEENNSVTAVAFSPNGWTWAHGRHNGEVWQGDFRDVASNPLPGHEKAIAALAYSVDGKLLAAVSHDGRVRVSEPETGCVWREFTVPFRVSAHFAFSGAGEYLAVATEDRHVAIWDVGARRKVRRFERNDSGPVSLAFAPDGKKLAIASRRRSSVQVYDVVTGRVLRRFVGHRGRVKTLAFSADGRFLASGSDDHNVFVWDVEGQAGPEASPPPLSSRDWQILWAELAGDDAGRAFRAHARLAASPNSLKFLAQEFRDAALELPPAPPNIDRLIADLDANSFPVRLRATEQIEALGRSALPALERALEEKPSLEVRRRVEMLLERLEHLAISRPRLRLLRMVDLLEEIGTDDARRMLHDLAQGRPDLGLRGEAGAGLKRLAER